MERSAGQVGGAVQAGFVVPWGKQKSASEGEAKPETREDLQKPLSRSHFDHWRVGSDLNWEGKAVLPESAKRPVGGLSGFHEKK